jgi:hypothetical protein
MAGGLPSERHARRLAARYADAVRNSEPEGPLWKLAETGAIVPELAGQLRQWLDVYGTMLLRYPPASPLERTSAATVLAELRALLDFVRVHGPRPG